MKLLMKPAAIFTAMSLLFAVACSDEEPLSNGGGNSDDSVLTGAISEDKTLDADVTYTLNGTLRVQDGAKLTIPAGTEIVSEVGTNNYIAILKGGMIDIQGTESNPVVMRSKDGNSGDWGGLVICGDATTTEGVDATAEVGALTYGGTNDEDNSGSISYLVIKNGGAQINSESQYNGLTLYAVGAQTTISNVAVIDGADDGVEFFGGTVSASNLYFENLEDDAVDWTEGWNGTITDTYVLHSKTGFSTAIEADGANGNPTINNFTAVSTVGGTALQFKKESGATITGLSLSGYAKNIDMKDDGALSNVQIEGQDADLDAAYDAAATVSASDFAWATSTTTADDVLAGELTTTRTLDAAVQYTLAGQFRVKDGGKLVIPAGTEIVSNVGTGNYIAVEMGGMIEVNGTSENPVVMRSKDGNSGDWGGLLLCGKSTTTEGENAVAEVGQLVYGGTNTADNSGSISYLVLKNGGAQINSESQYNGLTLYAVGSQTTISNVAIIDGADDGIEFFGGTVSASNVYVENTEDDAIDWTEGWNGTLSNTFVAHSKAGFSTAIEADGANGNPTISNFTAISSVGGTALQFKKQSGATITGLSLNGYAKNIDMKDNGALSNVKIEGNDADTAAMYDAVASVNISSFDWVEGKVNIAVSTGTELNGAISGHVVLRPSQTYSLTGTYKVNSGAKLVIPAGTEIVANVGTDYYIAVLKGGLIDINGTEANPVVMRSKDGNSGDWGGLVICGDATTTEGVDATAEVGALIYGGTNDEDNSGSISYLIIKNGGAQINSESQYNGLTLYAVGSGTTIDNVAVIDGADDGVEFFGGTVSATNMYFENLEDDSVDWTEGWNGTLENTYVLHSKSGFSTAIEADGANKNPQIKNFTAVSTVGGTALQFKKESGATITGLSLSGYAKNIDMKDNGALSNVKIEGQDASTSAAYDASATVQASAFSWATN